MFQTPNFEELVASISADMLSRLDGETLRRSDAHVLASVQAAVASGLYQYLDWIALQILPDTCDDDRLVASPVMNRGLAPKAAAAATGAVTVTGMAGAVLPAGTVFQRVDGAQFAVAADVTLPIGGSDSASVSAVQAGSAGNTAAATVLTLVSPVAGISSQAVVTAAGLVAGADAESPDDFRARCLSAWRQAAHGGASFDYVTWALEVAGVTRAWVKPGLYGVGSVGVLFVRDDDASLIPDGAEVAAVQSYLDGVRPVTAQVTALAPTALPVHFTLSVTPATAAVKAAVEAELRDLIRRDAAPGETLLISRVREAISRAAGESDHVLTAPAANMTTAAVEMCTFGSITWI
ncbi:baseplate J/gp47 family protein [Chitinibacteraceae bacterium HSL-7]